MLFSTLVYTTLFLLITTQTHALTIYTSTALIDNAVDTAIPSLSLPSYYTTLGNPPPTPLLANATFLTSLNLTNDCTWRVENEGVLKEHVLVYVGDLPPFLACNSDLAGRAFSFALMAQRAGAVGVVKKADEEVWVNWTSGEGVWVG
jgi:hypothetical protein